ncbi:hypothetical protein B9R42_15435 [Arthrospira platensis PCC 7345]|nr:hypothetical protein AP285_01200 [Arthrospira platensis YZ]KDR57396.1 hypothetical protein APPUASWS_011240 [Arthrospira platensis str. Paraca]TVU52953.1 MAG: hypothetical protein EA414_14570 [Arthrospira sp. PLM2.Bin9]BAI88141.1 hypothetical protein NIES39_A03020 [Arthrospira platensis NIES-39]
MIEIWTGKPKRLSFTRLMGLVGAGARYTRGYKIDFQKARQGKNITVGNISNWGIFNYFGCQKNASEKSYISDAG